MKAIGFLVRQFSGTVAIATLIKTLQAELQRRAEYALRYGVHPPACWLIRLLANLAAAWQKE
jgi:hypothetical protein